MLCLLGLALAANHQAAAVQNESRRTTVATLENRTLNFERNDGQYGVGAAFVSRGPNYYLTLSPTQVRVTLRKAADRAVKPGAYQVVKTAGTIKYRTLLIELAGANEQASMSGEGEISGQANYFIGNDSTKWRTGVPTYGRVRVNAVYPGINLIHYGNEHHLEYDFEIAPKADPGHIALRFVGADKISISNEGDLILTLGDEEIRQPKPVIYQTVNGRRKTIPGGYLLAGKETVKFHLGEYNRNLPLVIDPIVSYGDYVVGASGANTDDYVWAVATGADGSIYMAGETLTTGSATTNAYQTNLAGVLAQNSDVFVTRQNNFAVSKVYFTYLGGISYDAAFGLAVDADHNAYVTGYTGSTNFPTSNAVQPVIAGRAPPGFISPAVDCFIAKIGPYGSNLIFSTYYGGSGTGYNGIGDDVGYGIALDASQSIYVAGYTTSTNFPTANTSSTNAAGLEDGFVLKLGSSGTNVVYAMRLGGTNSDFARDIAVDPTGNPIVTGYTSSTNFPTTTNALQVLLNGTTNLFAEDAFISKIAATSGILTYSTFLGGTNNDRGIRLATDASGAAYVAGLTRSGNFPRTSTNFFSPTITNTSAADAFVIKLNSSNTNLDYAVTFGGLGKDESWDVAVDAAGRAHVVGATESVNFPTNSLLDSIYGPYSLSGTISGSSDAFISVINSNGSAFEYSTYFGRTGADLGYGVALDAVGNSYYVGEIGVGPAPSKDGFILKILSEASPISLAIAAAGTNVLVSWPGHAPEFSLESRTNILGTNAWNTVNITKVLTNNSYVVTWPATNTPNFFRLKR